MSKDPFKLAFGERLRATAAEFGSVTAQSIAAIVGAERAAVDTWLNGRALPKIQQAAKLCEAWHLTLDWLYLGKPDTLPYGVYVRIAARMNNIKPSEVESNDPIDLHQDVALGLASVGQDATVKANEEQ